VGKGIGGEREKRGATGKLRRTGRKKLKKRDTDHRCEDKRVGGRLGSHEKNLKREIKQKNGTYRPGGAIVGATESKKGRRGRNRWGKPEKHVKCGTVNYAAGWPSEHTLPGSKKTGRDYRGKTGGGRAGAEFWGNWLVRGTWWVNFS